jgi:mercuric ion transport protein
MMSIELIYDLDCPNVAKARANLAGALAAFGSEARWTEWDRSAADSPPYVRRYGSPTVLVNGQDVSGESMGDGGSCCRLYRSGPSRFDGAPSVEQIDKALRSYNASPSPPAQGSSGWKSSLATVPGIAFAFLPKLACPACWPAYAGLLSSVGLGFLLNATYLLPLTVVFLVLAIGALAVGARSRRGYGPFSLGLAASAVVLLGKFVFDSDVAMYGGIVLLVSASVWNAWPLSDKGRTCPACNPDSSSTVLF